MAISARFRAFARILVSVGAIAALVRVVPLHSVALALSNVEITYLCLGFALSLLARLAAAERTFSIGRRTGLHLSRGQTMTALFISNLWALIMPGLAAGSVATVYRYSKHGAPLLNSIGVLIVSRVTELAAFCALSAMGRVVWFDRLDFVSSGLFAFALCAFSLPQLSHWLSRKFRAKNMGASSATESRIASAARRLLDLIAEAPFSTGAAVSSALLQGMLEAASLLIFALSLGAHLQWYEALWTNGLVYLAVNLPVSISGLGVRDATLITVLKPVGIASGTCVALSTLMLAAILLNALLGALLQLRESAMKTQPDDVPARRTWV